MNSIVERLHMLGDDLSSERFTVRDTSLRAADLIEQQAERIKELEAERDAERDNCVNIIATYQAEQAALLRAVDTDYEQLYRETQEQLTAIRQRIDDAPVIVVNVGASYVLDRPGVYRLISKEDLQK